MSAHQIALAHPGPLSCGAAAKCRNLSGLRTTYSARMTSPSISNAAVCTGPSGASTMTPGRPLMVAKRTVKSSRHHCTWAFARDVNQEPRRAIGAVDHVQRRLHLAAAVRHDAHVAREQLRQCIEIARLGCRQRMRT